MVTWSSYLMRLLRPVGVVGTVGARINVSGSNLQWRPTMTEVFTVALWSQCSIPLSYPGNQYRPAARSDPELGLLC